MDYIENSLTPSQYCKLRKCVNWTLFPEKQIQVLLRQTLYSVTLIDKEQPVGMGRLLGDGVYYMIADVIVHPSYQRRGFGKKILEMLIAFVEKETPKGGCASIQLISEKGKESFYLHMGFLQIPDESSGFGMRKIIRK